MPVTNPVDLWPAVEKQIGADVDVFRLSLEVLLSDPEVDAVFLHVFISNPRSRMNPAGWPLKIRSAGKPVIAWIIGRRDDTYAFQKEALAHGIPVFTEISRAAECLGAVLGERRRPEPVIAENKADRTMPADLEEHLNSASGPLDEHLSKAVLSPTAFLLSRRRSPRMQPMPRRRPPPWVIRWS